MTIADKLALLEQTKEAQRVKLGLPKNLPFSQYRLYMQRWALEDIFKNGEQGAWLDLSDLSTIFQDMNGTASVTKDGQPEGLILDKSQSLSTDIPLINTDAVDFKSNNWRLIGKVSEVEGNSFIASGGGAVLEGLVAGRTHKLVATISHTQELDIRNGSHGGAPRVILLPASSKRTLELFFVADSTALYFRFGVTGTLTIHNIMVAEVKGNHATQSVATRRPIYRTDGKLHWSEFDGVDDTLSVQLPSGTYTEIKASRDEVTHKYPVNVNGSYTLGDLTQTKQSVSGLVLVNRQLTQVEIENITNLLKVKAGLPL